MNSKVLVTKVFNSLRGQPYLVPIPEGSELDFHDTVLGSIFDGKSREIVFPTGGSITVPSLTWDEVSPETMFDKVLSTGEESPDEETYASIGQVIRIPPTHVNLNSLINQLLKGEAYNRALPLIHQSAIDACHRLIQDKGLSWHESPSISGHLVRFDDLADDEIGIDPKDIKRMGWFPGDGVRSIRFPMASSTGVVKGYIRPIRNMGYGIALNSKVIKIYQQGDCDGDQQFVWKDPKDIGRFRFVDELLIEEKWDNFRSVGSLNSVFGVRPDSVEASLDKRQKDYVGPLTFHIWMVARALAIMTKDVLGSYGLAYDEGGKLLEASFDRKKGDSDTDFDVDKFINSMYRGEEFPLELLRNETLDMNMYYNLFLATRGRLLQFCSDSPVFQAVMVRRKNSSGIPSLLSWYERTGKNWEDLMDTIRKDLTLEEVARNIFAGDMDIPLSE